MAGAGDNRSDGSTGSVGRQGFTANVACDIFISCFCPPSAGHLSTHVWSSGGRPPFEESHHDRFGSRRYVLRHAGAWPGLGRGRRQGVQARRSHRFGRQAGSPDQERGGGGGEVRGDLTDGCGHRFQERQPPGGPSDPRPDRRVGTGGQRQLAAPRQDHLPDPHHHLKRADFPPGAGLDRGLHRLPARGQRRGGSGCAGGAWPRDVGAQAVAAGAGYAAALARLEGSRRSPRPI